MALPVIDTHTHIGRYGEWDCPLQDLIGLMDAYGVDKAIVGCMESNAAGAAIFEDEPIREFADAEPFDLQMIWKAQRTDFET